MADTTSTDKILSAHLLSSYVVDVHTHVFPPKIAQVAIDKLAVPPRYYAHYDGTLDGLLDSMNTYGIDLSWTVPVATRPSQVESIGAYATEQPRNRIVPFGAIHPDTENPREVLATFRSKGFVGFKMHPDYQECAPTDPRMEAIYEAAVEFGLIAFFHAGMDEGPLTCYGPPASFVPVMDQYPALRLHLAHLGGYQRWDEVEEYIVGRNVTLDTAYTFGDIDHNQFMRILRGHGSDKILFGTDGPWADPSRDVGVLLEIAKKFDLSQNDIDAIMHKNALRVIEEARAFSE